MKRTSGRQPHVGVGATPGSTTRRHLGTARYDPRAASRSLPADVDALLTKALDVSDRRSIYKTVFDADTTVRKADRAKLSPVDGRPGLRVVDRFGHVS